MKQYEGMFILKSDLSKEGLDKVLSQLQDVITKHKGNIEEIKEWAKQKLAYPIKKYKEGLYYLVNFSIVPKGVDEIKKTFELNDAILRVLITNR